MTNKLLLGLLLLFTWQTQAQNNSLVKLKVLLNKPAQEIKLNTYYDIVVIDGSQRKFRLVHNAIYILKYESSSFIYLSKEKLTSPVTLLMANEKSYIKLNGKKYRGDIRIISDLKEGIIAVEDIDFEKYIMGVLAAEMGPDWPLEALKAQAVASRTYASRYLNSKKDFDISDGIYNQVYSGFEKINPKITEAVEKTQNQVISYNGQLITTFFHANCGGHTTSPSSAFSGSMIKPLRGIKDNFCSESSHSNWSVRIPETELLSFIQKQKSTALKIKSVRVYSKDRSLRAVKIAFQTEKGLFKVEAKEMRKHFGYFEFKSTLLTKIEKSGQSYVFYGKGWGHGVGMCQDGAKKMADKGEDYRKILKFYYPGTKILDIQKFLK